MAKLDATPILELLDRTYADITWTELGINLNSDDLRPWFGVSHRTLMRCRQSGLISDRMADIVATRLGYNLVELYGHDWGVNSEL